MDTAQFEIPHIRSLPPRSRANVPEQLKSAPAAVARSGAWHRRISFDASAKVLAEALAREDACGPPRCPAEKEGTLPRETIRITKAQRDALYEQVRNHLAAVGDLWLALETNKDYATAERLAIEFSEDFRLMADLGGTRRISASGWR